jgi:UV DNA damage repair endonuclease
MAAIHPDRFTTCQSERKSVVSRRPSVWSCEYEE